MGLFDFIRNFLKEQELEKHECNYCGNMFYGEDSWWQQLGFCHLGCWASHMESKLKAQELRLNQLEHSSGGCKHAENTSIEGHQPDEEGTERNQVRPEQRDNKSS